MRIVAFTPFMLFVDIWTETCLVRIYHKFFYIHCFLVLIKILGKLFVSHKSTDCTTFFCAVGQRVDFLFFFVERLNSIHEV